jgi:hypothetical protein
MRWPLVLVHWQDSSEVSRWTILKDWEHRSALDCVSVGFLFSRENGNLTLIPHVAYVDDENRQQGTGMMIIPEAAVTALETIREAA